MIYALTPLQFEVGSEADVVTRLPRGFNHLRKIYPVDIFRPIRYTVVRLRQSLVSYGLIVVGW